MKEIIFLFFFLNLLSNCSSYNIMEVQIDKDHDTELSVKTSTENYFYVKNTDYSSSNTLYLYFLSDKNYINSVEICYSYNNPENYYTPSLLCDSFTSLTNYENNDNYKNDEKFYKFSYSNDYKNYFVVKCNIKYSYNIY